MCTNKISLLILILFAFSAKGQNLVPNYSFEAFQDIYPQFCNCGSISNSWGDTSGPIFLTPPWYSPSSGSPDCFKPCCPQWQYQVPKNLFGFQYPRTGIGYVYIASKEYPPNNMKDFREYLQVKLISTLISNRKYYTEFFISCIDSTNHATDRIGLYFSDTAVWLPLFDYRVLPFEPQISNPEFNFITDTAAWLKISGIYTAHGGERYITIGNFYDDANTHDTIINFGIIGLHTAGYYIDDVSVIPIEEPEPDSLNVLFIPNIFSPNNDAQNDKLFVRGQQIESLHFLIYNRWGNLVFESKDISEGWDGKQGGKPCETGVYVYRAEVTFKNGETVVKRGDVTVVR